MHSSLMRTAHFSEIWGGGSAQGECLSRGVSAKKGAYPEGVCPRGVPPPDPEADTDPDQEADTAIACWDTLWTK